MTDLTTTNHQLPAKIEDLAKFILIGQEKLTAVRAEIRAIEKLEMAKEVIEQKREEHRWLSEALLDAQVKMGELMKEMPKDVGGRPKKTTDTAVGSFQKDENDIDVVFENQRSNFTSEQSQKPKLQAVKELGFSPKQAERFQTLADNKDLVEEVKAEARCNNQAPTRSKVLQLVKERKEPIKVTDPIDKKYDAADEIHDAITKISLLKINTEKLSGWLEVMEEGDYDFYLEEIDTALDKLRNIKAFMTNPRNQKKAR